MLEPVRDIGRIEMRNYLLLLLFRTHLLLLSSLLLLLVLSIFIIIIIIIIIIITVIVVVVVVVYNSILCPTKPKKVKRLHYLGCASSLLNHGNISMFSRA